MRTTYRRRRRGNDEDIASAKVGHKGSNMSKLTNILCGKLQWIIRDALETTLESDAINLPRARQRKATQETVEFIDRSMADTKCFPHKLDLLRFSLQHATVDGLYCEFGAYKGESINFLASQTTRTVYGFDSFEGLPEDWRAMQDKGAFRVDGLPAVRENVRLHRGWFADSLPRFLSEHYGAVAFLHMDADLYSSTKTVLDLLKNRIVSGTVVQFDEFFNYPGWQEGEYRAFQESGFEVEYLGYTPFRQAAMRVR
jgi:hypothetical protein